MIGLLQGIIIEKAPPEIILKVAGVGYEIELPLNYFADLPEIGQELTIYTHLAVREDAHLLYGFINKTEKLLFRRLIKVNGVGPKLALAILATLSPENFLDLVKREEIARLTKIPGVGKKTAERLVLELKDKFKDLNEITSKIPRFEKIDNNITEKAIDALVSLGYKPLEAQKMVKNIDISNLNLEQIITQALKNTI